MNEYEDLLGKVRSNPTAPALPSQREETNYADLLARVRGKPDQAIVESRSITSSFTDPNNEGERSVLARRLKETFDEDWSPAAIDVPEAKRRLQVYQNNKVLSNAPKLSQQFTDPNFANVAHDDVAVLGQVERTFMDVYRDISITALKGAVGLPQAFVGLADIPTGGRVGKAFEDAGIKFNETQKILDSLYSPAQQLANKRVEQADGFVSTIKTALENPSTIATTVGQSIPQMLGGAGIARGLIAKFPALAPWIAGALGEGAIGAGSAAEQIRGETDEGLLTPAQSAMAAASGVGTAAFGAAGGKVAAKFGLADIDTMLAKGGADALNAAQIKQGFFKSILGSGISEGLFEELPQSIQEQMWQNWALDRPVFEGAGSAGAMGLLAGGVTGGAAGGFNATLARINRKTEQSVTQAQFIDNLTAASEQSALRQRDPDAYEQFVKAQAEGTGAENMYVDATQFADVLRQSSITLEMLEKEMPEVAAQLADALQTGGDVVIPTEKYAARLVGTDLGQNIAPHIRLDPDALSTFQAAEAEKIRDQIIKEFAVQADEKMKMDDAFVQSAKTVESKMLEQLKATKMYPDNVAKINAEFVRDFVVTQAAALNMMPEAFYDKYMYKVEMAGQQQASQMFSQAKPFNEEIFAEFEQFKTGQPVTFNFVHNTESATKIFGKPKKGDQFKRDMEPSGRYMIAVSDLDKVTNDPRFIKGTITFNNPLVLKGENWKQTLSDHYKKRGKELSKALIADGYDGVVTIDKYGTSEILDLTTFDEAKALYQSAIPRDLVIQHNLTAENLLHAVRMGGIPVPSLAITKKETPLTGFGEITLLGSVDMANPKGYANTRVFGGDIYSPRYPQITFDLDKKALAILNQELAPYRAEGERQIYSSEISKPEDLMQREEFKKYALQELGKENTSELSYYEMQPYAELLLRKAGAKEKIFQGFTYSGNRRYVTHTLENVVKILKKELRGGENFNYGVGSIRAKYTPQFNSIEQIRKAKDRLMDKEAFEKVKKEIDDEFWNLVGELTPYSNRGKEFGFGDTVSGVMYDAAKIGIPRALKEYNINDVPQETMRNMAEFLNKLRTLPIEYFEAKILRDVDLAEFSGAVVPEGVNQEVINALQDRGIKDIRYYEKGNEQDRAAKIGQFENLFFQKKKSEDQSRSQAQMNEVRGGFDPRRLTTILNEKADFSTFLHETAHFFLTVYADMANMPNATEQMKANMQTLLNWFGVKDLATWNAMSLEEQRKYHEQFAYNYEIYLFEGKAPSLQMQSLFERFAALLKRVYVSIRDDLNALYRQEHGTDLPILTGEVRQVMDRMLASEEQIKQAEAVRNMAPIFMGQEQSGMDDAQWAAYQDMLKEARESAITDLTKASMRQMKWLSNARGRILKELQKEADTQRKEVRKEVTAQIEAQPLYRAMQFLKRGEMTAEDGTVSKAEGSFKLSIAALEEMYAGEGDKYALLDWSALGHGQYGMTAKEGLHPDVVAEMFGFRSGDEMVRALLAAPPIKDAIDQQTDARMVAEYSEMSDPKAMELKVEEALHNEARARFVAVELRYLSKAQQPVRVMLQAAKIAAQAIIEGKKISEVRPRDYSVAEGRAAKLAAESMKKGDFDAAAQAKQNQLLQNQLAAEAVRVRMQVDKNLAYLRNVTSDANRKRMGADAGDQVDDLLQRFELRPITRKEMMQRADLAAWLNAQREAGYEPEIAPQIQDQAFRTSYRELSVEQFQDLVDAVRMVEAIGKNSQRLLTQEKEVAYETARDEIVASINANARGRKAKTRTPKTEIERIAHSLKGFSAEHIKANIMARIFDGGKDGGVVWKYLIRTANERGNMETSMRAQATEDLTKILSPILSQGNMGGKGMYFASVDRSFNRLERLGIAANWGNESNRQRLLDGEGWTTEQVLPILQSLTEAEWLSLQGIGDYFEGYKSQIAEKERRVYGKEPKWIEPSSFTIQTADGKTITLRGWYYPVKFDPMASQRAESFEEAEEAKRMMRGAFTSATTRRSFTKTRAEKVLGRPLLYSLDAMYSGINEVIHDLSWHEWLIDANKLLRSHSIDEAIRTQYGPQWKQQLKSWVEDVAAGERPVQGFVERRLGWVRQSVSAAGLGYNIMSGLQQFTGIASSMVRVGPGWVGRGIAKTIGDPRGSFAEASKKSSFMAERGRTQFRELNELRNIVRGQSKARRTMLMGTYFLMMKMQRTVDVPTWWGAYEKAISEGKMELKADGSIDDSLAVALADQAVIDSQGSGMVKDLSKIERYGQVMKLFTVFYSYMNTQYNLAVAEGMTQNSKGKMAANYMLLMMAPVVLSYALKAALTPSGGDDDWDWEKIAKDLAAEQISYLMGMMMILRELSFAAKTIVGAEGGNRDYEGPAGLRMISDVGKFVKQAVQGEFDTAFRKAAINVLGDFTGLPSAQINRTINGIEALAEGETENPAAVVLGYKQAR